jgi:hypothetical protein
VLGDGNQRATNKTTGDVIQPETVACCFPPNPAYNLTGTPGCPNKTSADHAMQKACEDQFNCSLPDPATGQYGSQVGLPSQCKPDRHNTSVAIRSLNRTLPGVILQTHTRAVLCVRVPVHRMAG